LLRHFYYDINLV